jgi:hypothetical protein
VHSAFAGVSETRLAQQKAWLSDFKFKGGETFFTRNAPESVFAIALGVYCSIGGHSDIIQTMKNAAIQIVLLAMSGWLLGGESAYAQSGFGGGSSMGGSSMGGSSMGGSSFGGGSMGGMSSSGAFGQRTLGSGAGLSASSNGFGAATGANGNRGIGFGNLASVGTTGGNFQTQSFVGSNGASGFVGALQQLAGQNGTGGMYGGGASGMNSGLGQFGQQNNRNQMNGGGRGGGQGNNAEMNTPVRITYTVGFNYPAQSASGLNQKLSTELSKSRGIIALGPIAVQMDGSTAVLKGTVATDHDRKLAAQLALLEPGVYQIRNELRLPSEVKPKPTDRSVPSSSSLPELPAP